MATSAETQQQQQEYVAASAQFIIRDLSYTSTDFCCTHKAIYHFLSVRFYSYSHTFCGDAQSEDNKDL